MRLTNPLWYLAAFLVALGSSMVGTVIAAGAWDEVRTATVTPANAPVDAAGRTLAVFTDQSQPDRTIVCSTRPADDPEAEPEEVPEATLDLSVDSSGVRWYLLAVEAESEDGLVVTCVPEDGRTDTAAYGFAVVDGFDAAGRGGRIGAIGTGAGLVLAIALFVQRRRAAGSDA